MNENEKAKADLESFESISLKKLNLNILTTNNYKLKKEKAVSSEEKFNKMKELYNKLKDEHVSLLRQVIYKSNSKVNFIIKW